MMQRLEKILIHLLFIANGLFELVTWIMAVPYLRETAMAEFQDKKEDFILEYKRALSYYKKR